MSGQETSRCYGDDVVALLDIEGAKVETVAINGRMVTIDLRHRGTDDGAIRVEFNLDVVEIIPWSPELGDFR